MDIYIQILMVTSEWSNGIHAVASKGVYKESECVKCGSRNKETVYCIIHTT